MAKVSIIVNIWEIGEMLSRVYKRGFDQKPRQQFFFLHQEHEYEVRFLDFPPESKCDMRLADLKAIIYGLLVR